MIENKLRRVRTINGVVKDLKLVDRDCSVTYNLIKTWCDTGEIPYIIVGNRRLVDLDECIKIIDKKFTVIGE